MTYSNPKKKTGGNQNRSGHQKVALAHEGMNGESYIAMNEINIGATRAVVHKIMQVLQPLLDKAGVIQEKKAEAAIRQAFAVEEELIKFVKANSQEITPSRHNASHHRRQSEEYVIVDTDDSAQAVLQKTMKVIQPLLDKLGEANARQKQEAAAKETLTMEMQLAKQVKENYEKAVQKQPVHHKEAGEDFVVMDPDEVTQTVVQKTMKVLQSLKNKLEEALAQQKQEAAPPIFSVEDQWKKMKETADQRINDRKQKIALKINNIQSRFGQGK